jgi:Flp pilus assembly protein TadD
MALVGCLVAGSAVRAATPATGGTGRASADSCLACLRASDPGECHQVALDLAQMRDWKRAIAIEEQIHERQPADAGVAASLARMYHLGTPNSARAIALYHAALHATSGYPPALLGLGELMEQKGETDLAVRYYARAVRERPDDPLFKVRLAGALLQEGREGEAQPLLEEVVKRWPGSDEAASAHRFLTRTALARP